MSSENSPESTLTGQDINVDGFKKRKLSEQLKLEREIFPHCIQALSTYCNKKRDSNKDTHRRSRRSSVYFTSKENLLFPEKVVETANKNVQRWLDQQTIFNKLPRKPFLDLNVNVEQHRQSRSNLRQTRSISILDDKENANNISKENKTKKRSHFKLTNTKTDIQHSPKNNSHRKSPRYTEDSLKTYIVNNNYNKIQDESGIFVDDTIVIEDSQSTFVDKDREALLAVMKADENGQNSDSEIASHFSEVLNYTNDIDKTLCDSSLCKDIIHQSTTDHVPFFKKSYLYENCQFCSAVEVDKRKQGEWKDKNILVKFETAKFIATINVIHVENIVNNKSSIALQTDVSKIYEPTVKSNTDEIERGVLCKDFTKQPLARTISVESRDIFSDIENKNVQNKDLVKQVVIYSSESDFEKEDNEKKSKGVLTEISQPSQPCSKIVRRPTPASSDSSEKENFDPNKRKRKRMLQKSFKKKTKF